MTDATQLLRQVNPQFVENGRPSFLVFRLTKTDNGLLSVSDGDLTTGADSWKHHTEVLKKKSVGVVAVSFAECMAEELPPRSDPAPFPEHAVIDCSRHDKAAYDIKRLILLNHALARDWIYKASPPDA